MDNFLISFSFWSDATFQRFCRYYRTPSGQAHRIHVRKVHYFISFAYHFPLWFGLVLFYPVIRIRSLSLRTKVLKNDFFWLIYFPDSFPTWNINCNLNSYFLLFVERNLLILAYSDYFILWSQVLFNCFPKLRICRFCNRHSCCFLYSKV